jgi:hypothetical protein
MPIGGPLGGIGPQPGFIPATGGFGGPTSQAQPLLAFPQLPTTAPSSYSSSEFSSASRGIASLAFAGRTWRFRTNPNSIRFSYILNTHVEQTFGGKVVQILSCKIEDLIVVVEAGSAGWPYAANLALWLRDFLDYQRNPSATPGVFSYTTRGWTFNVYALSIPFQDQVEATVRPLELHFKVQEDVSGVVSGAILDTTLAKLHDGIGFKRDKYNSGLAYGTYNGPNSGTSTPGQPTITPAGTPNNPTQGPTNGLDIHGNTDLGGAPSAAPTAPTVTV